MLNHLMLATLDPETQREWGLNTASRTDIPTTTELMTFLESRCRALELLQLTQTLKMSTATPRSSYTMGSKVSKPSHTYEVTKLQCVLCKDSHRLFKCDKFLRMDVKQRLNYAKQSKLCFNCLQPYVKNHTCSKQVCYHCHKKHHSLLHLNVQQRPNSRRTTNHNVPTNGKGPSTNSKLTVNEQSNALTEISTYCTFKGKSQNQTLLATAVVELRNESGQFVPCRAMLDSASQCHFITEKCVQRLRLSKTQTRSSIQGINHSSAVASHCVSVI